MQVLKNLYQVGGDLNGVTFDLKGALWNDGNSYILQTPEGLIMFDCGCGDTMDRIVTEGDILHLFGIEIEVMHLPGHSMGCTAYSFMHEQKHIVVSGDIIGTLLAGDFGWDGSIDFDKKIYTESLRRFAKIDMDIMLPGHGLIYFHKPQWRIEEALNSALIQWR